MLRVVIAACERAKRRGTADAWLRPTLLVAAFDASDADKAEQLADDVEAEGAANWKIASVLETLEGSLQHAKDGDTKTRLATVFSRLRPLTNA